MPAVRISHNPQSLQDLLTSLVEKQLVALAVAEEILVSQTVKGLVAGSGLGFAPRGAHTLKGIPGDWLLFAVTSA
jgi:hypothetical protein